MMQTDWDGSNSMSWILHLKNHFNSCPTARPYWNVYCYYVLVALLLSVPHYYTYVWHNLFVITSIVAWQYVSINEHCRFRRASTAIMLHSLTAQYYYTWLTILHHRTLFTTNQHTFHTNRIRFNTNIKAPVFHNKSSYTQTSSNVIRYTTNGSTIVNISTISEMKDDNYTVNINADTSNGTLRINCTGVISRTIRWVATINTSEVKY